MTHKQRIGGLNREKNIYKAVEPWSEKGALRYLKKISWKDSLQRSVWEETHDTGKQFADQNAMSIVISGWYVAKCQGEPEVRRKVQVAKLAKVDIDTYFTWEVGLNNFFV